LRRNTLRFFKSENYPRIKPIILIGITPPFFGMTKSFSLGKITCLVFLVLFALVLPVSGVVASSNTASPASTTVALVNSQKPMVTATVSTATPSVGDPVTISGVATGGNLSAGVQIWLFAGNYVNVTLVPVQADGTYSATYQTAGFPPATYYVFVQSPGVDGKFNIKLETTGKFSGQAVDSQTGALLVNFTGIGSVQDAAAATALADALNRRDVDDVYTKTTFQLVAPSTSAAAVSTPVNAASAVPTATAKSPLSMVAVITGLGICSVVAARSLRK
jgi:hypothetical protein